MRQATATACSNMALVKYWGKRDEALLLPLTGSLSMTLDSLVTTTTVAFTGEPGDDVLRWSGRAGKQGETGRASVLLDLVRAKVPGLGAAIVDTANSFPTAGGLASSASGFAALATAATAAAGLEISPREVSILARRGSGSACRSVLGGFVEWVRGERDDGEDSFAQAVAPEGSWDVAMAIAMVDVGEKDRSSRDAMRDSVRTSPYMPAWIETTTRDLADARAAVIARDLVRVGEIAERSFLQMHAVAMTSVPAAMFWKPATLALLEAVRGLRAAGVGAWATIDAGPHVAVICAGAHVERIRLELKQVPGVRDVVVARPGPGARVIS